MANKVQIPGLNKGLTEADVEQSRRLYNSLPSDEAQPDVEHLLQELAEIFVRNKADEVFGVHLIHGHLQLPEKNLLYGDDNTVFRCRWTKPTPTDRIVANHQRTTHIWAGAVKLANPQASSASGRSSSGRG